MFPVSNLFAVLFFLMLLLLAIDSQFATTESVVVGIEDLDNVFPIYPNWYRDLPDRRLYTTLIICVLSWLLGFAFICRGGYYLLSVVDGLGTGLTLFIVGCVELLVISQCYGVGRFLDDLCGIINPETSQKVRLQIL